MKLTDTQRRVLQAAADGDLFRSESGFDLYDCYIRGERRKVTGVVAKLNEREPRLLRIGEQDRFSRPWHLTDAGREALGLDPEETP